MFILDAITTALATALVAFATSLLEHIIKKFSSSDLSGF